MVLSLTRGWIMLKIYKQTNDYKLSMINMPSSFYVTLSSDYPTYNEQPGDFKSELLHDVDMMTEQWEVALVDMTYTGQEFDYIPTEHTLITISSKQRTEYEGDYVLLWDKASDLNIYIRHNFKINHDTFKNEHIRLTQQHYSWPCFKKSLIEGFNTYSQLVTCSFESQDKVLRIRVPYNNDEYYLKLFFASGFTTLLSPKLKVITPSAKETIYDYEINVPQPIIDKSNLILHPNCDCSELQIFQNRIVIATLTRQFWTVDMLKKAFVYISEQIRPISDIWSIELANATDSTFDIIIQTHYKKKMKVKTKIPATVNFSPGFGIRRRGDEVLLKKKDEGFGKDVWYENHTPFAYSTCAATRDDKYKAYKCSRNLFNNHYPDADSLVEELNNTCLLLMNQAAATLNTAVPNASPFSCNNGVVSFTRNDQYKIHVSEFLAKMLKLQRSPVDGNLFTCTGSEAVEMKIYKRSHFYVHCDIIRGNYLNNLSNNLLRTVPNEAIVGEKHTISFPDPQYQPVARQFLSYINMFITDQILKGILKFSKAIVYTLHFRKC